MSLLQTFFDNADSPAIRGTLHQPSQPSGDGLVLTHGAGGNCDSPLLIALAEAQAETGMIVLRCDLPFRQLRTTGPPRGGGAEDRAGLRRAVEVMRKLAPGRVFLGGQSYGGRQASVLAAEEPGLTDGLVLLSYPLHPPGKPEQLRTAHLPKIQTPTLLVSGSKDPFGSPKELEAAVRLIAAPTSFLVIEGGGHDLGFGRRPRAAMQNVPARIVRAFQDLFFASK